jgi:hypothetical protein
MNKARIFEGKWVKKLKALFQKYVLTLVWFVALETLAFIIYILNG